MATDNDKISLLIQKQQNGLTMLTNAASKLNETNDVANEIIITLDTQRSKLYNINNNLDKINENIVDSRRILGKIGKQKQICVGLILLLIILSLIGFTIYLIIKKNS